MAAVAAAIAKAANARVDAELYWPPFNAVLDSLEDQLAASYLSQELDQVRGAFPANGQLLSAGEFHCISCYRGPVVFIHGIERCTPLGRLIIMMIS